MNGRYVKIAEEAAFGIGCDFSNECHMGMFTSYTIITFVTTGGRYTTVWAYLVYIMYAWIYMLLTIRTSGTIPSPFL